ncbi:helix-turn-helix domain-containing protein [Tenacibaculum sp. ZS6-P6]|uniref:AraC family transcriptional regulator n=1 Tax=Tenacibaculum sp. ZS6-P6 TaxID=3447503 RepID=UPI003F98E9F1
MESITLNFNLLLIIDILSIATSLMLGFLFITLKSTNKKANIFLALFLWSLCLEVFYSLTETIDEFSVTVLNTGFLTMPLLFFYVNATLNKQKSFYLLVLFLPWFLTVIFFTENEYIKYAEYIFNITILILILKKIKEVQIRVKDFYSEIENKTLTWIRTIVFIYLFFHAFWIFEDIISVINESIVYYFAAISTILTFFMIYWIAYNGFSQVDIFKERLFLKESEKEKKIVKKDTKELFNKIVHQIQDEKIYSDQNLNLRILSQKVRIKEKELSKLINLHTGNNFYYFINTFRVNSFKESLSSNKASKLSLLGLANEAGFSSKSTFYAVFKKLEGITPKQYQKQIKKSE